MTTAPPRQGVFLSHATPGDNAFTLWLGGKLAAQGYDVWADIFRLKGGDDWERILEDAIRNKAAKVLVAANPVSVDRQGVRNEIKLAVETGRKIGDHAFIIPLRMEDYESPYLMAYAQWVDFKEGWATGLKDLLDGLEASGVPRPGKTERTAFWTELQLGQSRALSEGPEILGSNWLEVKSLPPELIVYDFAAGIFIGAKDAAVKSCPLPLVPFGRGILSFAPQMQLQEHFGDALPLKQIATLDTQDFAATGSDGLKVAAVDARRHLVDLMRRGVERYLDAKGLQQTELASQRRMWWADKALGGLDRKVFAWPDGPSGRRQILGQSKARNVYWHYGVSCWPATSPLHHIRLSGHVIFTIDGHGACTRCAAPCAVRGAMIAGATCCLLLSTGLAVARPSFGSTSAMAPTWCFRCRPFHSEPISALAPRLRQGRLMATAGTARVAIPIWSTMMTIR
jgi:hypothetical protein